MTKLSFLFVYIYDLPIWINQTHDTHFLGDESLK